MARLEVTVDQIGPLDQGTMAAMAERLDQLTKPQGSLGRLEELAIQLAGIRGTVALFVERKIVIVAAGDHGVTEEGVSAYPREVTGQMLALFAEGRAAINVLSASAGAGVIVVNAGVAGEPPRSPEGIVNVRLGPGTRNFLRGPAMTREQATAALEAGVDVAERAVAEGADLLVTGDMGIGNTTAAAAIVAAVTGADAQQVVGRGTGVDDAGLARKTAVLREALALHHPDPSDPLGILAKVGGFEIGVLAGVVLAGAAQRRPVVLDGVVSGAAALIACGLAPGATAYCIAGHRSTEPAHSRALAHLGLEPLLDLRLRLGEGTGAALALPLIDAAVAIARDMWTFEEAGVAQRAHE
ncbi:MAG: nicotinate-nucleotide--dimethylbenzimidazole phosphoribosyltransferase [Chloroflexi bacterium]|nr:nicotinate-nucleotide--dimethylbenzimidazole phosphoribosyltransferase [Chloroflexota bacterium]